MKTENFTLVQLASCYLNLKQFGDAENALKKHLNDGETPELYYYLGLSYTLQEKYDEAIEVLSKSIYHNNGHTETRELLFQLLINKAQSLLAGGDLKILTHVLGEAVKYSSGDEKSRKLLSHFESIMPVTHIKNGEREKAATIWKEKLTNSNYSDSDTIHNLAFLYYWWAISYQRDLMEDTGTPDQSKSDVADYLWEKSIMYWFSFINSTEYWDKLRESRSASWKIDIPPEEIVNLKTDMSKTRLLKVLEEFQEEYKLKGEVENSRRIQSYINNYYYEKRTASYWQEFSDLLSKSLDLLDKNEKQTAQKILRLKGPFTLSFINEFFGSGFIGELLTLAEKLNSSESSAELIENMRLFYTHPGCGKVAVIIREIKDIDYASSLWEDLCTKKNKKDPDIQATSFEAQYLKALILYEKGRNFINIQESSNGLAALKESLGIINKSLEKGNNNNCKTIFSVLNNKALETYSAECVRHAKKLNVANKTDEAIVILEEAFNFTKNDLIRSLLCGNYCEKGQVFLKAKNWAKANEYFNKALALDRKYSGAVKGLATSKNNEGLDALNRGLTDRAISLLEEANNLENDKVVRENLASAYNSKAVSILNSLGSYSSTSSCDSALRLLKKGIKLLNEGLDIETISATWGYTEEYMFNILIREISDGLYKTMLRNLWVGERARKNLRGY